MPLVSGKGKPASIVHEVDLLRVLQRGDVSMDAPASSVAAAVGGLVYPKGRVEELYAIFAKDQVAIVVDGGRIVGIVSQISNPIHPPVAEDGVVRQFTTEGTEGHRGRHAADERGNQRG